MINNVIGKSSDKRCVISKLLVGNLEQSNSSIIVNTLAQHFADVGKMYANKIAKSIAPVQQYLSEIPKNQSSIYLVPVTECEIKKIFDNLTNKTSSGWDGISNKLLKKLYDSLFTPLKICINVSFQEGLFPDIMKLSYVSPLHKSGKTSLSTNYRPISLLSVISKIYEKFMYDRIYNFLQCTNQLYKSQYGFRKRHSCKNAIQELLSVILKANDNKKFTGVVFLDLSKAFDTLDHDILLKNWSYMG